MPQIAYLTATWPKYSETFIRQELNLLLRHLPILPVAIYKGDPLACIETKVDNEILYLNNRETSKETRSNITQSLGLNKTINRSMAIMKHKDSIESLKSLLKLQGVNHIHAGFADLPGLFASKAARDLGISYSVSIHAADLYKMRFDDA